jgi:hypothetical protein
MAVITVSKIQVRSGLQEDLPALDTGEFGWCVDTQRLYVGKGTLAEGAPIVGVTEILTEYSIGSISTTIAQVSANIALLNGILANVGSVVGNLSTITTRIFNNQANLVNIGNVTINSSTSQIVNYNITRNNAVRVGVIRVSSYQGIVVYDDEYTETTDTGVTLFFTGNTATEISTLGYISTNTGDSGNITYNFQTLQTVS